MSQSVEIPRLDRVESFEGVLFHRVQQIELFRGVQEHIPNDVRKDVFRHPGDAGVIKQVALLVGRIGKEKVRSPPDSRGLSCSGYCLQQFHAVEDAAVLILPSASGGEQLLQDKRLLANVVFIPGEPAKIIQCAQYRRGEDRAGTQSRSGRNGRKQRDFES